MILDFISLHAEQDILSLILKALHGYDKSQSAMKHIAYIQRLGQTRARINKSITDGRMDGQTDRPTDMYPLIES